MGMCLSQLGDQTRNLRSHQRCPVWTHSNRHSRHSTWRTPSILIQTAQFWRLASRLLNYRFLPGRIHFLRNCSHSLRSLPSPRSPPSPLSLPSLHSLQILCSLRSFHLRSSHFHRAYLHPHRHITMHSQPFSYTHRFDRRAKSLLEAQ